MDKKEISDALPDEAQAAIEQIAKDWGIDHGLPLADGYRRGEMVIFSAGGGAPFVPRDPEIHRGSLLPLIVHPIVERKSMMEENMKSDLGNPVRISMEMSDEEMRQRMQQTVKGIAEGTVSHLTLDSYSEFVEVPTGGSTEANDLQLTGGAVPPAPEQDRLKNNILSGNFSRSRVRLTDLLVSKGSIAIDCKMNHDGSLSFGVVPPDSDHPPLKPFVKAIDPTALYRSIGKVELRPEHKLDAVLSKEPKKADE